MWISITLFAALIQSVRFVLQKHLRSTQLSTLGATFSRFFFAWPCLLAVALIYSDVTSMPLPQTTPLFWAYGVAGALGQIGGTICTVALFAHRNFAVGAAFKNTEALLIVPISLLLLGEGVSGPMLAAIALGVLALLALSESPGRAGSWRARVVTPATGLGLGSGLLFALAAVGYRGASLNLVGGDLFLRSALGLGYLTLFQTLAMAILLSTREPGQIARVIGAWRVASLVGLTSMLGSFAWFSAFALQKAAYVKALGQTELIFSFLFSTLLFKERSAPREIIGIATLLLSVLCVILFARV
ncbi:MAG: DMT family transporter [Pseudomonadota bacterium]